MLGRKAEQVPRSPTAGLTRIADAVYLRGPMSQAPALQSPDCLSKAQAGEVLRYWLASLQLEEALATRPRARRPLSGAATPRIEAPSPGHDYFKLPLDAALGSLLEQQSVLRRAFDAELAAFFETWLATQYRRSDDDRELMHLIAFPVVMLPRGELAGLLRYGVRVRFGDVAGPPFKVPSRSERRRKLFPSPPNEVRLSGLERSAKQWPFFVDTRLLQQQLGVARESIDASFAALRAEPALDEPKMLKVLCQLLETEAGAAAIEAAPPDPGAAGETARAAPEGGKDGSAGALVSRIAAAVGRLLARQGGRARAYPVALVIDGTRAKTTWYLQRELQMLLEDHPDAGWELDSCLGAYLSAETLPAGRVPQRALFPGPALSDSQRFAAERAWGSRLTAVQGPPGTGKTTLILHLAAQALVQQVETLADTGDMGVGSFVVTSTNNRAVDNVIDPLNQLREGLPLALRAGSQAVCEQVLAPQLQRASEWLNLVQTRAAEERAQMLSAALDRFQRVRTQLQERSAEYTRACRLETQRNALSHELKRARAAGSHDAEALPAIAPPVVQGLYDPLQKAHARLQALAELCDGAASVAQLSAVDRHYRRSAKRELRELQTAIRAARLTLDLELPPPLPPSLDPKVLLDAWAEAVQTALARIDELLVKLVRALGDARLRKRSEALERQLNELPAAAELPVRQDDLDLQRALFEAALEVRAAWAAVESETLGRVVARALAACRADASLRSLWSEDPQDWAQLRRLFGLWGCTLLSLGNCFPARSDTLERAVIDEAGQCHPSYAVGALLRSRAALIIGDVHQLEPVIDLEPADDERVVQACKLTLEARLLAPYRVHSEARCSVQALADRAVCERPRLIDHYRCQPEIIAICDQLCRYGLQIHTPRQAPAVSLPFLTAPVHLIDVAGEQERLGGSWHNPAELDLALELLQALLDAGVEPQDVALITPYRGQLELLHRQLVRMGVPLDRSLELVDLDQPIRVQERGLTLGTVHRFQGGERSIVLFSSVVTRRPSLAFLDERANLLNVAVSRARHRFIALGHRALLARGERTSLLTRAAAPLSPEGFRRQLSLV